MNLPTIIRDGIVIEEEIEDALGKVTIRRTELNPLFPSNRGQIAAMCDHRLMGEDGYSGIEI